MRRLILHAGQPKTGSSAIQQFCAANRAPLRRRGYLFPSLGREGRGNHKFLLLDILGRPQEEAHRGAAIRFREEIDRDPASAVILSSEWLFAHLVSKGTASRVLHFFRECRLEPEIVIYIRPDADRVNSGYVQQTKSFFVSDDIADFAKNKAERGSGAYASLARLKEELGPRLILLPYDRNVAENGAAASFLAAIGVSEHDPAEFAPEGRANESVGPIAVAAARDTLARLRRRGMEPSRQQRQHLARALRDMIAAEPAERAYQGVDERLAASIEAEVAEARQQFAASVWGKSWTEVFPPKERKPLNVFDPASAGPAELQRYRRFVDALAALGEALLAGGGAAAAPMRHGAGRLRRAADHG